MQTPTQNTQDDATYQTSYTAIRKARRFATMGLYEWLMTEYRYAKTGQNEYLGSQTPDQIAARTRANNAMHTIHLGYYHELMREIPAQIEALNDLIGTHLDRSIAQLDPMEHAVLLIGCYEMTQSLQVPFRVVLDEARKLNEHFGATGAYKLIIAVLDKIASQSRPDETAKVKSAGNTPNKT